MIFNNTFNLIGIRFLIPTKTDSFKNVVIVKKKKGEKNKYKNQNIYFFCH